MVIEIEIWVRSEVGGLEPESVAMRYKMETSAEETRVAVVVNPG